MQIERLEEVQRKLKYEDVVHCIQDVQTCWNSSYYAWDRLFYLKDVIIQLQADLYTSTSNDKNKLVDVLLPFEEATRKFSGGSYVKFLLANPANDILPSLLTNQCRVT
ncbi:hypothetical protein C1645_830291 [Glomus cerebriforme]|uniref:Uncharacterized protein n=1 Tax=Glomus cerebriforme TaxID=658196 RepID=A0A397SMD1_9GLOM|nr:hypothetical protein C1645_830291 [Glomus cerebriforme]